MHNFMKTVDAEALGLLLLCLFWGGTLRAWGSGVACVEPLPAPSLAEFGLGHVTPLPAPPLWMGMVDFTRALGGLHA